MHIAYKDAVWLSGGEIREGQLIINTRRGSISPPPPHPSSDDRAIDASECYLYPCFINAHEHLEFNHYPRTRYRERYDNASQWAADMQAHLDEEPFLSLRAWPLWERCWVGGFKNLICGVATVVHHNPPHPELFQSDFPVQVHRQYAWAHSLYLSSPSEIRRANRPSFPRRPFYIHLAEGTDGAAADEIFALDRLGALSNRTVLIHGVGLLGEGLGLAVEKSRGLVWCPSSNHFLLGQTAPVEEFFRAGKLALGSDSHLTADGNLFDEIRAAVATGQMRIQDIFRLVTDFAAKLAGIKGGTLDPGKPGHLFALPRQLGPDPHAALLAARPGDVLWIRRWGTLVLQQDKKTPNIRIEGRPYRLEESLWKTARQVRAWPGMQISFS